MQEQYDKFREYVEELEKCRKELENLRFENNSMHEKIYRVSLSMDKHPFYGHLPTPRV